MLLLIFLAIIFEIKMFDIKIIGTYYVNDWKRSCLHVLQITVCLLRIHDELKTIYGLLSFEEL